jgi:hypothetical protein
MSTLITAATPTTQESRTTEPAITTAQPIVENAAVTTAPTPPTPAAPPTSAAVGAAPTAPAAQVAPALVSLGQTTDGTQRITMRLEPPELGQVQIRIERPADAPARVEITVERSETLTLLLRDQPQLQRALDQAGVPPEGRSIAFHVAPPEPAPRSEAVTPPPPGAGAGGLGGEFSHSMANRGGNHSQHAANHPDDDDATFTPVASPRWMRAGLDITA